MVGPVPVALVDLYSEPHRGLRWALMQLLNAAAQTDFQLPQERESLAEQVATLCDLFEYHMDHEERFVHPALLLVTPSLEKVLEEEHAEHRQHMNNLKHLAQLAVRQPEQGRCLYLSIARFVQENLAHMEMEEVTVQRTLEEHFDWGTLQQIHNDLIASIPPEVMQSFLQVMLPPMCQRQRREFLSGPRQGMPADVFLQVVTSGALHLPEAERAELLQWAAA